MAGLVPAIYVLKPRPARKGVDGRDEPGHDDLFWPAVFRNLPMSTAVSPLAPTDVPDMPAISGVKLATAAAGIRYKGRTDVLLAVMDKGTAVAGVVPQSNRPAAPAGACR